MQHKKYLKIIFILSVISIFLPWFTYDANIMGYCWGYCFLKWFAVPMIIIALYLFASIDNKVFLAMAELSMVLNLVIMVFAFGRWQEVCNIVEGVQWQDGFVTALPTYWLSAVLFLVFFIVFQYDLLTCELGSRH